MRKLIISGHGKIGAVGDSWFAASYPVTEGRKREKEKGKGDITDIDSLGRDGLARGCRNALF